MQKYAIIRLQGKQYKVSEGQELLVDKFTKKDTTAQVLLLVSDGKVEVGKPTLEKSKIQFKVLEEVVKGEKVDVFKYKSKSRSRKHIGFRPKFTKLQIEKIK